MKIEMAGGQHVPELVALARAMHAESNLGGLPLDEERVRRTFKSAIDDVSGVYCVVVARASSGAAAGYLFGTITRPWFTDVLVAHDHAYFVAPEFRGSSAAVKLLHVFRRWAVKRGAVVLNVSQRVGVGMARFDRFMRRMGFSPRGTNFSMTLERRD